MTAIAEPSTDFERATFDDWDAALLSPPPGSNENDEAANAAGWILTVYLYQSQQPGRRVYFDKVQAWARTDLPLFGKIGTAIGSHAIPSTSMECVGYWKEGLGSTMVWQMMSAGAQRRYLIAGELDRSYVVQDVYLFDVTNAGTLNDPDTNTLKSGNAWARLGRSPSYSVLATILDDIQQGSYKWPNN